MVRLTNVLRMVAYRNRFLVIGLTWFRDTLLGSGVLRNLTTQVTTFRPLLMSRALLLKIGTPRGLASTVLQTLRGAVPTRDGVHPFRASVLFEFVVRRYRV